MCIHLNLMIFTKIIRGFISAEQENMTLTELKKVIADIYPGQTQFYVIEFKCL